VKTFRSESLAVIFPGAARNVINRIVNLNKPSGITSHQAVAITRRLLGAKKAGHAGTLDPLATGVLLVCLDEATKVSRFLLDMDKTYLARVKLGERTDTCDSEGTIIERRDFSSVTEADIHAAAAMFRGRIRQKPPMYSAVKVGGETLYKLARKGIEIDRPERTVEIYEIAVRNPDIPFFDLEVSCAKGTYIRTLCDDIGTRLGTGAHLVALERTSTGFFGVKESATFDEMGREDFWEAGRSHYSIDDALTGLREIVLQAEDYERARNGAKIAIPQAPGAGADEFVRLKGPSGNLFGIGRLWGEIIHIERILNL
jgi:tRNA pseudouridine55 synthase